MLSGDLAKWLTSSLRLSSSLGAVLLTLNNVTATRTGVLREKSSCALKDVRATAPQISEWQVDRVRCLRMARVWQGQGVLSEADEHVQTE